MEQPHNIKESALEVLRKQLRDAGVDISKWGTGEAKTLEDLQKEIEKGETVLEISKDGKLLRKVIAGGVYIFYNSPDGKRYRLKEDRQIFQDGRERKRNFPWSVSEKIKQGENPKNAMLRGVKEELGIDGEIDLLEAEVEEEIRPALSYPGLQSHYVNCRFILTLNNEQYQPGGYKEQGNLTTYFTWEEIK